jgi:hypothetical protein
MPPDAAHNDQAAFRVGIHVGIVHGGGVLRVAPQRVTLTVDRMTRLLAPEPPFVHTDKNVDLVTARLVPPWFNVAVLLRDGDRSAAATTWLGGRGELRRALQGAGFDVHERTTLVSRRADVARSTRQDRHQRTRTVAWTVLALASLASAVASFTLRAPLPLLSVAIALAVGLSVLAARRG